MNVDEERAAATDEEEGYDDAQEAVIDWEEQTGITLEDDQFRTLVELVEAKADRDGRAVVAEVVEDIEAGLEARLQAQAQAEAADAHAAWEQQFADGLEALEAKLGRELTDGEARELYEAAHATEPDVAATFEQLFGERGRFNNAREGGRLNFGKAVADRVYEDAEAEAEQEEQPMPAPPEGSEQDRLARGEAVAALAYADAEAGSEEAA